MGRKRLEEGEKKVDLTLKVKKKYVEQLKEQQINISAVFEVFIEKYLLLKQQGLDTKLTFEEFLNIYQKK
jgi:post-segregation antitoxin (ccd killing protein)